MMNQSVEDQYAVKSKGEKILLTLVSLLMIFNLSIISIDVIVAAEEPGTVKSHQQISDTEGGGFLGIIPGGQYFGHSVASIGDINGDGTGDLAVGEYGDNDGGINGGAVWILFMNADETVKSQQKINATQGGFTGDLTHHYRFGSAVASLGDIDGDGVADIAVGARLDSDDGIPTGAVWILFLHANGTVKSQQKINATQGGFSGVLQAGDLFGWSLASPGDMDGDGVADLAVGAVADDDAGLDSGAVWLLFLNTDGTVKSQQKIGATQDGLVGALSDGDRFGSAIAALTDIDGDGVKDLAVGSQADDGGGTNRGAVWILLMNTDGTVKSRQKISDTQGGFTGILDDHDLFGFSIGAVGDLNGDMIEDIAVGAIGDEEDDGGFDRGAVWIVFLNADGTVKSQQKISSTEGEFTGILADGDAFGWSVTALGNRDGDSVIDLVVGARMDNDGGTDRGAVWILKLYGVAVVQEVTDIGLLEPGGFAETVGQPLNIGRSDVASGDDATIGDGSDGSMLNHNSSTAAIIYSAAVASGMINSYQKISHTSGNFPGTLGNNDRFGHSVANIGDLDGDGVTDFAVGAYSDDDGGSGRGAVWLLLMNANGTVKSDQKISAAQGGFSGVLNDHDVFGASVSALGDFDGDGVADIAVGANADDDGGSNRGALWILLLNPDGTVKSQQKISATAGGFGGVLDDDDFFASSIASLGDLDGDGVTDIAVGARLDDDGGTDRGAVWILFLNADGRVKSEQKISDTEGAFDGVFDNFDNFGQSIAVLGDADGDGVTDIVVGARYDDNGGKHRGAVWILLMNTDGTVKSHQKISDTAGGFGGILDDNDNFGIAVSALGDVDGDGITDIAVGARQDDDGGINRGAVWIVFLNADATVKSEQKISASQGGFSDALDDGDFFGYSMSALGDFDGDGVTDIAVGAQRDDDGGSNRGAVWILNLNGMVPTQIAPDIDLLEPDGVSDGADQHFNIRWTDSDPDDAASISLYYDSDNTGQDGTLIVAGLSENDETDQFTWDTRAVAQGEYFIYATIDDGSNLPVTRYSAGTLSITHPFPGGPGMVRSYQKISYTSGNFFGMLGNNDRFGHSVANIGDFDGDGVTDFAVGAYSDDDGGSGRGAVWLLLMNANGTVKSDQKISATQGGFSGVLNDHDAFGTSVSALGDFDGDGVTDIAVGAYADDDGGSNRGAVWILLLNPDGTVKSQQKISATAGGFGGVLDDDDFFASSIASLGDLDGDGVTDIAVGARLDDDGGTDRGAVWILFLNADGRVKSEQKISDTEGAFDGVFDNFDNFDNFGQSIAVLGDADGDGVTDIVVGARYDDNGGKHRGAVWILLMNTDGTVKSYQKISDTAGGFGGVLDDNDNFGVAVAALGDVDGDGITDIAVGARQDDDGGSNRGAVWILLMNADATVKSEQKISFTQGGFTGGLDDNDFLGYSMAALGDFDGDGLSDIVVGALLDDDGGSNRGALWILNLNGVVPAQVAPSITLLQPDGVDDSADQSFNISWTDSDPDDDASISLYYDNDNSGEDGTLIVSGLSEDDGTDSYLWNTSALVDGDYFIYAVIDDGVNAPVTHYSPGGISIAYCVAGNQTWTTPGVYTFVVENSGCSFTLEAWGGAGGKGDREGGKGGYAKTQTALLAGEYQIYVAAKGADGFCCSSDLSGDGAQGGGASYVLDPTNAVLVAGSGGGGAGGRGKHKASVGRGGIGGGSVGGNGDSGLGGIGSSHPASMYNGGSGGTQSANGQNGNSRPGATGASILESLETAFIGGAGASRVGWEGGGGGGGAGYYGGGGGSGAPFNDCGGAGAGGGGGSGYGDETWANIGSGNGQVVIAWGEQMQRWGE